MRGDLIAPARGRLEITDPFLGRYVLAEYDAHRLQAAVPLTPMTVLRDRAATLPARRAAALESGRDRA